MHFIFVLLVAGAVILRCLNDVGFAMRDIASILTAGVAAAGILAMFGGKSTS